MFARTPLSIILMASFVSQIIQVGVFPVFLAQKLSDLSVPLASIGWLVGSQWIAVLIFAPIVPKIAAYISLNKINKISGLLTLSGLAFAFSNHLFLLIVSAPLIGAGLVWRWVACDVLVVHLSPKDKMGRMIGFHEALMGFALAVGPLLFTWLSLNDVLLVSLILGCISTGFFFLISETTTLEEKPDTPLVKGDYILIKIALLAALAGGFIETAAVAFFPFYFEKNGFILNQSAWFIASFGLGGTLLQLPLGALADRLGFRGAQILVCIIGLASLLLIYFFSTSFAILIFILFLFGGAVGAFNTLAVLQGGQALNKQKSASAMALIAFFYTLGGVVGPILSAWMLDHFSQNAALLTFAGAIVLLFGTIVFSKAERRL